jgi:hypothetical protein
VKIVTHTDFDGICCAALFIRKFGSSVEIKFATVQQAKQLAEENFPADYTCDLPKVSQSMNIDHHKTNYDNLKKTNRLTERDIVLPGAASATDLVFNYLDFSNDPTAEEIRELGHLADTALLPIEYKPLDIVLNMNVDDLAFLRELSEKLANIGKGILETKWLESHHQRVVSVHQKTQDVITEFLELNPILPCFVIIDSRNSIPGKLAKEVFKPFFDKGVIIIALIYKKSVTEPIRISFRVTKAEQDNYDVSLVARQFGGGGHRMAAACTTNATDIPQKLMKQLKKIMKPSDTIEYYTLK